MTRYVTRAGLQVGAPLDELVDRALPGTGVTTATFWQTLANLVADFTLRNRTLLAAREDLQARINNWHRQHRQQPFDTVAYKQFLVDIGYLEPEGEDFEISTANVDAEIASIAGPQLVVPISNARFSLNAANARWGSLYDAFYGTDLIAETDGAEKGASYNPVRGAHVVAKAAAFLDEIFPLAAGSHADAVAYTLADGALVVEQGDGTATGLAHAEQFAGYSGAAAAPDGILLVNNGLHAEIQIDAEHPIGREHAAGVKDVL